MAEFAAVIEVWFEADDDGDAQELWEHVKANEGHTAEAQQEALQIAAMACRSKSKYIEGDDA